MTPDSRTPAPPRHIAICGHAGVGKSEVQTILQNRYGVIPIDSRAVMCRLMMESLGLPVSTHRASLGREARILGKTWTGHEILNSVGAALEALFGPHIVPFIATRHLPPFIHSFSGVRGSQGAFYKNAGGVVIEIVRPGLEASCAFDDYDRSLVDLFITNDGTIEQLRDRVIAIFDRLIPVRAPARGSFDVV